MTKAQKKKKKRVGRIYSGTHVEVIPYFHLPTRKCFELKHTNIIDVRIIGCLT